MKISALATLLVLAGCGSNSSEGTALDETPVKPAVSAAESPAAPSPFATVLMDQSSGCLEGPMAQFGRYLGNWTMTSTTLSREDGKTWIDGGKAQWNFMCVGDGIAVQDFWIPETGGSGSNLRMYDPKPNKWDIAWVSTGTPAMSHISATQAENGDIIMTYVFPAQTPMRRITFFNPGPEGWNWQMEMSQDNGENWIAVVKMQARPT